MTRNPDFDAVMIKKTEIERMEAEIKRLTALAQSNDDITWELTGENVRLRTALQRIADDGKNCNDYCRTQARRALEPKP